MSGRFLSITPDAVRSLAVGVTLREHGIVVEKLRGDERWTLEFMFQRKRFHRVLGYSSEGWTRRKCEEKIDELKSNLRHGLSALPVGRRAPLRFNELADWYLAEMEATGGKNLQQKRGHINDWLKSEFGDLVVDQIAEADIGRFAKTRIDEGASPSTANRYLATLGHILSTAVRHRKIQRAPCRVPRLTEPEGRITTLSAAEVERLVQAAQADPNPGLWLFVEIGLNTAMRASEITAARFEHIDWERRRLYIPRAKAGGRHQPMTSRLAEILRKEQAQRGNRVGWIFPSPTSRTGHVPQFNEPFRRAVEAAGLDPGSVTPHVMRHTAITRLIEAGSPLPTVQLISGHKTIAMVLRYTHVSDPHVDIAMDALNKITQTKNAS